MLPDLPSSAYFTEYPWANANAEHMFVSPCVTSTSGMSPLRCVAIASKSTDAAVAVGLDGASQEGHLVMAAFKYAALE
jgi:hypothetical protein